MPGAGVGVLSGGSGAVLEGGKFGREAILMSPTSGVAATGRSAAYTATPSDPNVVFDRMNVILQNNPEDICALVNRAIACAELGENDSAKRDIAAAERLMQRGDALSHEKAYYRYGNAKLLCILARPASEIQTASSDLNLAVNAVDAAIAEPDLTLEQKLEINFLKILCCSFCQETWPKVLEAIRSDALHRLVDEYRGATAYKKMIFEQAWQACRLSDDSNAKLICLNKILEADPLADIYREERMQLYRAMRNFEAAIEDALALRGVFGMDPLVVIADIREEEFSHRWGVLTPFARCFIGIPLVVLPTTPSASEARTSADHPLAEEVANPLAPT